MFSQAHDSPVRAMTWSHNDMWMLTADHGGYVKYWQSNMNNVKMFQAHKEAIREARFIHNIPFSVVPIVMVKLFSKCILGAGMHGLCQILGYFLHPINTIFFLVFTHSPFCWHFSEVVLSRYQPLQYVRDVLSAAFCTGFLFSFMVNNVYTLFLFITYCVRQESFIPNKEFSL